MNYLLTIVSGFWAFFCWCIWCFGGPAAYLIAIAFFGLLTVLGLISILMRLSEDKRELELIHRRQP